MFCFDIQQRFSDLKKLQFFKYYKYIFYTKTFLFQTLFSKNIHYFFYIQKRPFRYKKDFMRAKNFVAE